MKSGPTTMGELLREPFTIHALNNYTHMGLSNLAEYFELQPDQLQAVIRGAHHDLVLKLNASGIEYRELANALVPRPGRHEVAFIFDSTRAENGMYGYSLAEKWIPAVKNHGPEKTALRVGDVLHLPDEFVWSQFDLRLVKRRDFSAYALRTVRHPVPDEPVRWTVDRYRRGTRDNDRRVPRIR